MELNTNAAEELVRLETLRQKLVELDADAELVRIRDSRDEVIDRYQPIFAPDNLPKLTAEDFLSFLDYKHNKHWFGINRYGSRMVQDMPALRTALGNLLDETRPLAQRYTEAIDMIKGLDKAVATPILLVSYPNRYGVWNGKSEAGLRQLGLFPLFGSKDTSGKRYAAINKTLIDLASALGLDLWTLDVLWEVIIRADKPLAPPFDAIFADREQAEWAFDFFRETVEHLGGRPDDADNRFALTLPKGKHELALNFGSGRVLSIADNGQHMKMLFPKDQETALPELKFGELYWDNFLLGEISSDHVGDLPPELKAIYDDSLDTLVERRKSSTGDSRRANHYPEIFQALFDIGTRDRILSEGLTHPPILSKGPDLLQLAEPKVEWSAESTIAREFKGFTADSFAFLTELVQNNNKAWMDENRDRWESSVREPMRHLFADLGPHVKQAFNPYLHPNELEIRPDAHHTLARIKKNWNATPDSQYYSYYWGAFYRQGLTRQTDAQLFTNILPTRIRFGFFVGEQANKVRARFRDRVLGNPAAFMALVSELGSSHGFEFIRIDGTREMMTPIRSVEDLEAWLENGDFDVLVHLTPDEAVNLGPALADEVLSALRRVFPVYLWAVADDYEPAVERYLADQSIDLDDEDLEAVTHDPPSTPYTTTNFLTNTHLPRETLDDLLAMIDDRKQVIFSGPPGTGKTWVARELGKLLTGLEKPPSDRLEIIQFHPAYSYEDFIEGIRPKSKPAAGDTHVVDYPTLPGVFRRFCDGAARHPNQKHVFIIDEINRGNIPRIFGELMYLLEYRDQSVPLPYSGDRFRIPDNVILIGTMNTADRSIALVDMALRRRFHFFQFKADPDLFGRWLVAQPGQRPRYLSDLYRAVVRAIADDHYAIGPSYFMKEELDESLLRRIWTYSILPQIAEYYTDQPAQAREWDWDGDKVSAIRSGRQAIDTVEPTATGDETGQDSTPDWNDEDDE